MKCWLKRLEEMLNGLERIEGLGRGRRLMCEFLKYESWVGGDLGDGLVGMEF